MKIVDCKQNFTYEKSSYSLPSPEKAKNSRRKSKHNTTTQEEDIVQQQMQFFNGPALGSFSAFLSKVKKQSIIIFVGAQASKVRLASIPPFKDLVDGKLL